MQVFNRIYLIAACVIISSIVTTSFSQYNTSPDSDKSTENSSSEIGNYKPFTFGINYYYGFGVPHAGTQVEVRETNPKGYELNFSWLLYTSEVWDDCHCYPRIGFLLSYLDFDLNETFGSGYVGAIYFMYFFGLPSTFNFILQGKAGISYLSNPWDINNNPENMAYSTNINYWLSAGVGFRIAMNRYLETQILLNMNHNSNAAFTEPNGGINYPGLTIGMAYTFDPIEIKARNQPDPYLISEKKKRWDIGLFWGISAMPYPDLVQVPMYGINVVRSWQVVRVGAITAGVELEMNGRTRLEVHRDSVEDVSPWRGSIQAGWEFLMGKTIISFQLGRYFVRSDRDKAAVYHRYGLVYRVLKHFYAGVGFKAHGLNADHLDLRFTYSF
ncbi:MAG: acyloxyacyl hydrolase [Ignavibacterium sp.]|nr:MAG: acyloxyacyl hydrolase [Ignavibacterium sp.]